MIDIKALEGKCSLTGPPGFSWCNMHKQTYTRCMATNLAALSKYPEITVDTEEKWIDKAKDAMATLSRLKLFVEWQEVNKNRLKRKDILAIISGEDDEHLWTWLHEY